MLAALVASLAHGPALAVGLREGFEGAVALSAEVRALEARRAVVAARRDRADALLPGAPVVGLGYRSDQVTRDRGLREIEGDADAPLWLPGEARALARTAEAQAAELAARIARQRLLLAGEVRTDWWNWMTAVADREAQVARVALARALERDLNRQVAAGNVPQSDLLAVTSALYEAAAVLRARDLAVREAAIAFRVLTGLEPSPGPEEQVAELREAGEDPRLAASRALVEAGRAAERLAILRDRANPELGLQLRHERDAFGEPWGTRVQVRLTLPLQSPPVQRERLAEARAAVTTGTADLVTTGRALTGGLDRAREARGAALELVATTEARFAALAAQARLYEAAYRAGQLPLLELVRVRTQLADADAARRRAAAGAGRATSLLNQALGVEPR